MPYCAVGVVEAVDLSTLMEWERLPGRRGVRSPAPLFWRERRRPARYSTILNENRVGVSWGVWREKTEEGNTEGEGAYPCMIVGFLIRRARLLLWLSSYRSVSSTISSEIISSMISKINTTSGNERV